MITVVPAYGRDYSSKKQILSDWKAKKDFLIQDMSCVYDGRYLNINDAVNSNEKEIKVRYNSNRKVAIINVSNGVIL